MRKVLLEEDSSSPSPPSPSPSSNDCLRFEFANSIKALPNAAHPSALTPQLLTEIDRTAPTAIASARATAPSSPIPTLLSKIISSKTTPEPQRASTSALANDLEAASDISLSAKFNRRRQPGLDDRARASASAPASPTLHDDKSNSSNTVSSFPMALRLSVIMANRNAAASATVPASPMASFPPMRSIDGLSCLLTATCPLSIWLSIIWSLLSWFLS
mmetsp:Transcript_19748/g.37065  ORF Transcript_19748/g.37065 Transcript_19748/m.37065 type:complete len:217 (+) Transcript_19748:4866-5516(+)